MLSERLSRIKLLESRTIQDGMAAIEEGGAQLALIVDAEGRLVGTLTDGDIRRALLRGALLTDPVGGVATRTPTVALSTDTDAQILAVMRAKGLHQIPVIDIDGRVVALSTIDEYLSVKERPNLVVVMAGGPGQRLGELTAKTPKPMLRVGSRPILETIIRNFISEGFRRFKFAVHYRADQIEEHFGDGAKLGVEIEYLREDRRLGTAGALSLLPTIPQEPILVTNADLLMKERFGRLLDLHLESGAEATMAIRTHEFRVPFGVIREQEGSITAIEEKPALSFSVNAGIYVLGRDVVSLIPKDAYVDMTTLFEMAIAKGLPVRCERIDGYWLDIGRLSDYERALVDFPEVFG